MFRYSNNTSTSLKICLKRVWEDVKDILEFSFIFLFLLTYLHCAIKYVFYLDVFRAIFGISFSKMFKIITGVYPKNLFYIFLHFNFEDYLKKNTGLDYQDIFKLITNHSYKEFVEDILGIEYSYFKKNIKVVIILIKLFILELNTLLLNMLNDLVVFIYAYVFWDTYTRHQKRCDEDELENRKFNRLNNKK